MIACPPEPQLRAAMTRGVEVRTKYASCRTKRHWRNPVFTRLCWLHQVLRLSRWSNSRSSQAPAVSDRIQDHR